ncbi:DUF6683 family protein [Chitinivorax sp. B]|uniref:DUF6683 family protein n=1 Tax=Chitinivorax sp. B TaxID=2502235 RepID=UPI0010F5D852|nr:DUF6683 family protein [Chitinivorax sp. B]
MSPLTDPAYPVYHARHDDSTTDRLRYARSLIRDVLVTADTSHGHEGLAWSSVMIASADPLAPVRLAAGWPVSDADQRQAQATYEQLLLAYHLDVMEKAWPAHDLGVALAVFLIGNYQMATDHSLNDDLQQALVKQLRQRIGRHATLAALPVLTRQELFEELAISGTLMLAILLQNSNGIRTDAISWAKPTAQDNLQTLLRIPHTSLYFDEEGVHINTGLA